MEMELSEEQPAREPIVWPSPEWNAAFRAQTTAQTAQQVKNHATTLLKGLDGLICLSAAEDLVHDAIVATAKGSASWRPDRVGLRRHLADHVEAALDRLRERVARTESIEARTAPDPDAPEDEDPESTGFERDHVSVTPEIAAAIDLRSVARAAEAAVWRRFAADQAAMSVLNCIAAEVTENPAIAAATGRSVAQVETIRKRIERGLDDLPQSLRRQVRNLLS